MSCINCQAAFFNFGKSKKPKKVTNISIAVNTVSDLFWGVAKSYSGFGWSTEVLTWLDRALIATPFIVFVVATAAYMCCCNSSAESERGATERLIADSSQSEVGQQQREVSEKHLYAWFATFIVIIVRGIIEAWLSSSAHYSNLKGEGFLKENFPAVLELIFFMILICQNSAKKCVRCCLPPQDERLAPIPADHSPGEHKLRAEPTTPEAEQAPIIPNFI